MSHYRTVYNRNGERCIGWVIPSVTWRGRERWRGKVEREFVSWHHFWQSWRRYPTRERAVDAVNRVLDRIADHDRWERV